MPSYLLNPSSLFRLFGFNRKFQVTSHNSPVGTESKRKKISRKLRRRWPPIRVPWPGPYVSENWDHVLSQRFLAEFLLLIWRCGSKFYERLDSDKNWTNFEYIFSEFKTENIKFLPIFFCCKMDPCFPLSACWHSLDSMDPCQTYKTIKMDP